MPHISYVHSLIWNANWCSLHKANLWKNFPWQWRLPLMFEPHMSNWGCNFSFEKQQLLWIVTFLLFSSIHNLSFAVVQTRAAVFLVQSCPATPWWSRLAVFEEVPFMPVPMPMFDVWIRSKLRCEDTDPVSVKFRGTFLLSHLYMLMNSHLWQTHSLS